MVRILAHSKSTLTFKITDKIDTPVKSIHGWAMIGEDSKPRIDWQICSFKIARGKSSIDVEIPPMSPGLYTLKIMLRSKAGGEYYNELYVKVLPSELDTKGNNPTSRLYGSKRTWDEA